MSASLVVDCSIAMAWLFHDKATPKTEALLNRLATETALVPAWWSIEITNVFAMAERKGRITATQSDTFIANLRKLGVERDQALDRALTHLLALCRSPCYSNSAARVVAMLRGRYGRRSCHMRGARELTLEAHTLKKFGIPHQPNVVSSRTAELARSDAAPRGDRLVYARRRTSSGRRFRNGEKAAVAQPEGQAV